MFSNGRTVERLDYGLWNGEFRRRRVVELGRIMYDNLIFEFEPFRVQNGQNQTEPTKVKRRHVGPRWKKRFSLSLSRSYFIATFRDVDCSGLSVSGGGGVRERFRGFGTVLLQGFFSLEARDDILFQIKMILRLNSDQFKYSALLFFPPPHQESFST